MRASGRYDILTAHSLGAQRRPSLVQQGPHEQQCPFVFLSRWSLFPQGALRRDSARVPQTFLFAGVFLGYLGYEAGKALHDIPTLGEIYPYYFRQHSCVPTTGVSCRITYCSARSL